MQKWFIKNQPVYYKDGIKQFCDEDKKNLSEKNSHKLSNELVILSKNHADGKMLLLQKKKEAAKKQN